MAFKDFIKKDVAKLGNLFTPDNLGKVTMGLAAASFVFNTLKDKADKETQTNEVVERVLKKMSDGEK